MPCAKPTTKGESVSTFLDPNMPATSLGSMDRYYTSPCNQNIINGQPQITLNSKLYL